MVKGKGQEKKKEDKEGSSGEMDIDEPEETPSWTVWAAGSYAVVMLILGLPLWWYTTAVQRVALPYNDMLNLHQTTLEMKVPLVLVGFGRASLEDEAVLKYEHVGDLSYDISFELTSVDELDVLYKSSDVYDMDKKMCELNKESSQGSVKPLYVYYTGRSDYLKKFGHRMLVGNCRNIYYISNSIKLRNLDTIMDTVKKVVSPDGYGGVGLIDPQSSGGMEDTEELQLPLSAGYNILFSLLVPEPEVLDSTWAIKKGIESYVSPMLKKLDSFADFSVRSQVLYYVKLNLSPKLNPSTGVYEIPYEQLPLVINPVESKLTSFVSQNPVLNFLVYTAPCDKVPLQILDIDGIPLVSNAFLVPRWGGIFVYNPPCGQLSNSSFNGSPHEVSVEQVMAVMISQFRSLIGLSEFSLESEKEVLNFRGSALRDWEVDLLIRQRLRKLLDTASNTLNSLGKLLDKITNIVVTEEVGDQVEKSVSAIKSSFEGAKRGELDLAQKNAIEAFKSSEIAFHHPKNLAQLYFPDDQKYAIYIPLFLPVGIPVLLSLRFIFQYVLSKRRMESKQKVE